MPGVGRCDADRCVYLSPNLQGPELTALASLWPLRLWRSAQKERPATLVPKECHLSPAEVSEAPAPLRRPSRGDNGAARLYCWLRMWPVRSAQGCVDALRSLKGASAEPAKIVELASGLLLQLHEVCGGQEAGYAM